MKRSTTHDGAASFILGFVLSFGLGACLLGLAGAIFITLFPGRLVEFLPRSAAD